MVYPTHGAGSLCSTGIASTSWSTIGYERRHDPLLAPMEVEAFARALLSGQPTIPRYFARMRPMNQAGPRLLGGVRPGHRAAVRCAGWSDGPGSWRGRGRRPVAAPSMPAAHVPGSLSIPAGPSFGTWLGWVVEADAPIVLIVDDAGRSRRPGPPGDRGSAARRSRATWTAGSRAGRRSGRPVEDGAAIDVDDLAAALSAGGPEAPFVIDVRQPSEFEAGHVPGAVHIGAGELPEVLDRLPRDRDDRHGLRQRLPLEHRGVDCCAPAGSAGSRRSPAAPRTGKRTATRSITAPARTASTGPPRPPRRRGHAH